MTCMACEDRCCAGQRDGYYSRLDRLDGLGEPLPEVAPIDHSPVWVMLALLASVLFLVGAPSFFYLLAIGLWIVTVLNFWKEVHRG